MLEVHADRLEAGVVVAGRYRLERLVGSGGMGVVWAAHDVAARENVALKFLRDDLALDGRSHRRFLREARAAMRIRHPSVIRIRAVDETSWGAPFFVMDLIAGETLRALLGRGVLDARTTARILVPVIDAIAAAHAVGIVHRDLKPENIIVAGDDVRVLDFGVAKELGESRSVSALTSTGGLVGTPVYMAPEQIFADDVDGRADVWSLGVIVHECLVGTPPTRREGLGPLLKVITTGDLPRLADVRPRLPPEISALADRMLSRERERRPALAEVRATLLAHAPRPLTGEWVVAAAGLSSSGICLQAVVDAFGEFKTLVSRLFVESGVGALDRHGVVVIDPRSWYPIEIELGVLQRMRERVGPTTMFNVGLRIPASATFPPNVLDAHAALSTLDVAYHLNHARDGEPMFDLGTGRMLEGIGHYTYERRDDRSAICTAPGPFPCELNHGIVTGVARRFEPHARAELAPGMPSLRSGAERSTYVVEW